MSVAGQADPAHLLPMSPFDTQKANEIVFPPAVRQAQERLGSRGKGVHLETKGRFVRPISEDVAQFIALRDSVFLATAGPGGRPYIQHRGGPPGFLKLLDDHTIGFADFPATASTSPSAIWRRTTRRSCSCPTTPPRPGSSCGAARAWSRTIPRCSSASRCRATTP